MELGWVKELGLAVSLTLLVMVIFLLVAEGEGGI